MSEPREKLDVGDLKDKFLECPVCVEFFNQTDRRPRLLHSCLHAFCTPCLEQLLVKEGKGQITCPLCRHVQKVKGGIASLPKDPVRDNLVEYLQISGKQKVFCQDCPDENEAKSRCMECGENLCQDCGTAHRRHRSTRNHRVVPFEELESGSQNIMKTRHFCTNHPDRFVECYCTDCGSLCCLMCAVIDHKGHDLKKLGDAAEEKVTQIETLMTDVNDVSKTLTQAKNEVEEYVREVLSEKASSLSEINDQFDTISNLLKERRAFLTRELEERSESLVAEAEKTSGVYDDTLAEIASIATYFSNAKKDEVGLLKIYPSMEDSLQSITARHSGGVKKFQQKLVFRAVEEVNLKRSIAGFGMVTDSLPTKGESYRII